MSSSLIGISSILKVGSTTIGIYLRKEENCLKKLLQRYTFKSTKFDNSSRHY